MKKENKTNALKALKTNESKFRQESQTCAKIILTVLIAFYSFGGSSPLSAEDSLESRASEEVLQQEQRQEVGAEKIVVTSSRTRQKAKDSIVATEVISSDLIKNSGRVTLAQLLATQAGLFLGYNDRHGNYLAINGLPAEYSLILIDGRRVIGRNDNANHLGRIMVHNAERIEIIKGAHSAVYGSEAIAGIVNIITKSNHDELKYDFRLGGGQLERYLGDANVGFQLGLWQNDFSINYQGHASYQVSQDNPELRGRGNEQYGFSNKSKFIINDKNFMGFDIDFNRRFEKGVVLASGNLGLVDEAKRNNVGNATLFYDFNSNQIHHLRVEANYSYFDDHYLQDYRSATATDAINTAKEDYGQLNTQYTARINAYNRVSLGVENIFEQAQTERIPNGPKYRQRNAVYLQDEITLPFFERIKVMPGLRLDTDTFFGQNYLPRLALRYDVLDSWKIQTAYGWGFRAPSLKEMYYDFSYAIYRVVGSEDLRSERSQSATLKNEFSFAENYSLEFGGFYHDIKDKINRVLSHKVGPINVFTHTNINKVYSRGLEASVKARLPLGFCANLGYSYTDAFDVDNDRELDGVARHSANIVLSYDNSRWGSNITFTSAFFSARSYYDSASKSVVYKNSFGDVQLQINQRVYKNVSLFIIAENLTNEFNETTLIRPPRGIWGGFSVKN